MGPDTYPTFSDWSSKPLHIAVQPNSQAPPSFERGVVFGPVTSLLFDLAVLYFIHMAKINRFKTYLCNKADFMLK
jgi:hypothetical protein